MPERKSGHPTTIIDSGANTSIVGTGWHVTHITMHTANVIRFDKPSPLYLPSRPSTHPEACYCYKSTKLSIMMEHSRS